MSAVDADARDWQAAKSDGITRLEVGDCEGAIEPLTEAAAGDPSGESEALLGLAQFRCERYAVAAEHYERALAADGDAEAEWRSMHAASRANAVARVDERVPDLPLFRRDELLAPPPDPELPRPGPERATSGLRWRFRYRIGHVVGSVGGTTMHALSKLFGRRYHDAVWTNWYRKGGVRGILTLAYMRDRLNAENLRSTYPHDANIGFQPDDLEPPVGVTHFRTADGSWNNLHDPKEGAAGTRFERNVADRAIRPATDRELLSPDPRAISRRLLTRGDEMIPVPFLNLLAASWIQFQNHDWITHGENLSDETIELPLDDDDPIRRRYRQATMSVGRTQPDPTRDAPGEHTPITFVNEVTHWWDGSQIYGSDLATQKRLRSGVGGKLRLTDQGTLPLDEHGVEDSGMVRNWWVGLAMLHELFAREHNAICDQLARCHPDWDDDRLFNVARLVNAAVMAKIHSVEWTPAILPNGLLDLALNSNWYGMLSYRFRKPGRRRTVATYNVRNPELGGVVGNARDRHGAPYGLTEEFVEVYRLHSLLPETLHLRRRGDGAEIEEVPFAASRQAGSPELTARFGTTDLFYSFGKQHPGALVLHNYPRFLQELSVPGLPVLDMAAVDILRARERGVPRYNEFRDQLGLQRIRCFADLTDDPATIEALDDIYDGDVDSLDLMVGTLAESEERRPVGFGFGETMFQIFILNATRRLQADRFYTDDFRAEVYTPEGMRWIDTTTFKDVILRHHPELASTGLGNIKNAFEPWDDDAVLNPRRHPLRAFDPSLTRKNRWTGEAWISSRRS